MQITTWFKRCYASFSLWEGMAWDLVGGLGLLGIISAVDRSIWADTLLY